MKYLKLFMVGILFTSAIATTGCSKDDEKEDTDSRDQYVGTWKSKQTGSMTLYESGQAIGTVPIDEEETVEVSKSGSSSLLIDGHEFSVSGNKLSSDPESITETDNGVNIVGVALYSGQLTSSIITINSDITGSWSNSNGASGNLSGSYIMTLTK